MNLTQLTKIIGTDFEGFTILRFWNLPSQAQALQNRTLSAIHRALQSKWITSVDAICLTSTVRAWTTVC